MNESEMDNRGSKSSTSERVLVKEQRVDGNCSCLIRQELRCTLLDGESHYQTRSLSNLISKINTRSYCVERDLTKKDQDPLHA